MDILVGIASFITGAVIYSFLNTVIYRLPEKKAVIGKGCVCSTCGHDLHMKDRIPILLTLKPIMLITKQIYNLCKLRPVSWKLRLLIKLRILQN